MGVNVPSGYKHTKVGVIPEDWNVVRFREVLSLTQSGLSRKLNSKDIGVAVIRSNNIKNNKIDIGDLKYWYEVDTQGANLNNYFLEKNDMLVNFINSLAQIGKMAIYKDELDKKVIFTTNILRVKFKDNVFLNFIQYVFQTKKYNNFIASIAKPAVNQASFTTQDFKKFMIALPPLKEQQKIAQILTIWDDTITKQEALIKAKEKRKKGLMQKLLSGEIRFDGFDEEWEEVRFNTVFERVTRKNIINDTNVLTISAQHGLINQEEFFNKSVASKDLSGYILLKNGEFAYNKSYSNGYPMGAVKRLNRYEQGVLSSLYIYFAIKDDDSDFYEHYFEAGFLNKEIYKIAQEGARNHGLLNMSVVEFFNDMHVLKPPLAEQHKIAEVLTNADKEIDLLKNELEALKEQKRGLMQRLLSGEVRV